MKLNQVYIIALSVAMLTSAGLSSAQQFSRVRAATPASVARPAGARPVAASASNANLGVAMRAFAADMGRMPRADEGLDALIKPPAGAKNWRGPYISTNNFREPLTDPWGMKYRYVVTPTGKSNIYSIASNGPDKLPGTSDDLIIQF